MTVTQTISLKGHLIDSLTLAKVIDLIQSEPATAYKMDYIDVGYDKRDFSIAQLKITAPDETQMGILLDKLKTYGAVVMTDYESLSQPCLADKTPPENAIFVEEIHRRVMLGDDWIPLEHPAHPSHVLLYDPQSQTAKIAYVDNLKQGDLVIVMKDGAVAEAYNLVK